MAVNIYLENSSSTTESPGSSNSCISMEVDEPQRINRAQVPLIETSSHCCNMEIETAASDCAGKSSKDVLFSEMKQRPPYRNVSLNIWYSSQTTDKKPPQ